MYYADLAQHEYPEGYLNYGEVPIGWLDGKHPYTKGIMDSFALDRLWEFCKFSKATTFIILGYHECEFCKNPAMSVSIERGGVKLQLGSAQIYVLGLDGIVYVVPDLIYHYVTEHNYLPPQEFIDAVAHSPLPNTFEYMAQARKYDWFQHTEPMLIDMLSPEDKTKYLAMIKALPPATPAEFKLKKVISGDIGT